MPYLNSPILRQPSALISISLVIINTLPDTTLPAHVLQQIEISSCVPTALFYYTLIVYASSVDYLLIETRVRRQNVEKPYFRDCFMHSNSNQTHKEVKNIYCQETLACVLWFTQMCVVFLTE